MTGDELAESVARMLYDPPKRLRGEHGWMLDDARDMVEMLVGAGWTPPANAELPEGRLPLDRAS